MPTVSGSPEPRMDVCSLELHLRHEVVPSVACSLCLAVGLVYSFFGYRCFRMVMFLTGFLSGSLAVLLIYQVQPELDVQVGVETKAGVCLGVGVVCGLVTMLVSTVGLLLCGLQLGGLLSLAALLVVGHFHSLAPAWVPLSATAATSVVGAALTLRWQKLFTVVYTCVVGAVAVALCVGHLTGTFTLTEQVLDTFHRGSTAPLCWFHWAVAGIVPMLSLSGVLVQWNVTARGASHTAAAQNKQRKYAQRRGPPPHRRPRRPPPLKRYAGDVLAPSYLRSLQERQTGTGSSSSSISTVTHTLIDFDLETGSMVPLTAALPGHKGSALQLSGCCSAPQRKSTLKVPYFHQAHQGFRL